MFIYLHVTNLLPNEGFFILPQFLLVPLEKSAPPGDMQNPAQDGNDDTVAHLIAETNPSSGKRYRILLNTTPIKGCTEKEW